MGKTQKAQQNLLQSLLLHITKPIVTQRPLQAQEKHLTIFIKA